MSNTNENDLVIPVENGKAFIWGRKLHKILNVKSNYTTWFKRMCKYGYSENNDFRTSFENIREGVPSKVTKLDHIMTESMAMDLVNFQRSKPSERLEAMEYIKYQEDKLIHPTEPVKINKATTVEIKTEDNKTITISIK